MSIPAVWPQVLDFYLLAIGQYLATIAFAVRRPSTLTMPPA
jgi:hypothetical protein